MSRVGGTSSPPTPPLKWIWKHRHHQNIAICKQIACFEMSVRPFGPFSFGKGPSGRRSLPYGRLRLLFFIVTRRPVQSIALRALNNRSLRRLRRLRLLLFFARRAIFLSRTSRCTLSSFWDQNELSVPRRSRSNNNLLANCCLSETGGPGGRTRRTGAQGAFFEEK